MDNINKLFELAMSHLSEWKGGGGVTSTYICPTCGEEIETAMPMSNDRVCDSAAMCYHCGHTHFVVKSHGSIIAHKSL